MTRQGFPWVWGKVVCIGAFVVISSCTAPPPGGPPGTTTTSPPTTVSPTTTTTSPATSTTTASTSTSSPSTTMPTTTTTVAGQAPGLADPSVLTDYTGPSTITGGSVVIENKRVNERLTVEGGQVTIRNSSFRFEDYYQLINDGGTVLVENSEFDGMNGPSNITGATGSNLTVRWSRITGFENGLHLESNSTAERNLIAQPTTSRPDAHSDGIEVGQGSNIVIRSNTIDIHGGTGATGCINIGTPYGDVDDVVVEDNDVTGGTYSLYVRQDDNGTSLTNVRVVNNRWHTPHIYGTHSVDPSSAVTEWRGNTLDGTPIDLFD
jgi:hypothetical protein